MRIIDLTEKETEIIENRLSEYDEKFIKYPIDGKISIGIKIKDDLVAGLEGCITTFNIFSKIQSNESLTAGTSRCRRMGNIEKAAAGF